MVNHHDEMILPDLTYLRRIAVHPDLAVLLHDKKFLEAQRLFFSVVDDLGGTVDFDIADMREVHAVAALGEGVKGRRVLDIGCGSTEHYVLTDTFRDRYPPFFAEMLSKRGAHVTGIDIRPNPGAHYDHRVLDLTQEGWMQALEPPYDLIACFNIFNAPESPFENNAALCDRIMDDMRGLLAPDGLLIVTLRDEMFAEAEAYIASKKFELLHRDGNGVWVRPLTSPC